MKNASNISNNAFLNATSLAWLKIEGYKMKSTANKSAANTNVFKMYEPSTDFNFYFKTSF